ncbi:MAG: CorA family divalent cation transporter [Alkalispirochaeta sp.]
MVIRRLFRKRHVEWRGEYTPPGEAATTHEGVSHATVYDFGPGGLYREEELSAERLRRLPPLEAEAPATVRLIAVAGRPLGPAHDAAASLIPLTALEREDLFSVGHQVKVAPLAQGTTAPEAGALVLLPFAVAVEGEIVHSRISLAQCGGTVVLLYDAETPVVHVLLERIRRGTGRVRQMSANYVAYLVIDAVVDTHSGVSAFLLEQLEDMEEQILDGRTDPALFRWIQDIRIVSVWVRRLMSNLEHEITAAVNPEARVFEEAVVPFAMDVREHSEMIQDSLETRREQAASLIPLYTAISGAAMNEVMKTLTIIATIFIPLTFVAGIYGMNFEHMPELTWPWGYPVVLGGMLFGAAGMIWLFRRRKWL